MTIKIASFNLITTKRDSVLTKFNKVYFSMNWSILKQFYVFVSMTIREQTAENQHIILIKFMCNNLYKLVISGAKWQFKKDYIKRIYSIHFS